MPATFPGTIRSGATNVSSSKHTSRTQVKNSSASLPPGAPKRDKSLGLAANVVASFHQRVHAPTAVKPNHQSHARKSTASLAQQNGRPLVLGTVSTPLRVPRRLSVPPVATSTPLKRRKSAEKLAQMKKKSPFKRVVTPMTSAQKERLQEKARLDASISKCQAWLNTSPDMALKPSTSGSTKRVASNDVTQQPPAKRAKKTSASGAPIVLDD